MTISDDGRAVEFPSAWSWVPWTILGIVLVSYYTSQSLSTFSLFLDGVPLVCMMIVLGWELHRKTMRERDYYDSKISALEKRIEIQSEELASLKEKQ
jgi:hypothetical protein